MLLETKMAILAAFDGSEHAYKVLYRAANLLKEEDELILLYVKPSAIIAEFEDIDENTHSKKMKEEINKIVLELKEKGIKAKGFIREGDVAQQILNLASELRCSLIVVGAGLSKIGKFTLGSVADKVARHADRAVLIVR